MPITTRSILDIQYIFFSSSFFLHCKCKYLIHGIERLFSIREDLCRVMCPLVHLREHSLCIENKLQTSTWSLILVCLRTYRSMLIQKAPAAPGDTFHSKTTVNLLRSMARNVEQAPVIHAVHRFSRPWRVKSEKLKKNLNIVFAC